MLSGLDSSSSIFLHLLFRITILQLVVATFYDCGVTLSSDCLKWVVLFFELQPPVRYVDQRDLDASKSREKEEEASWIHSRQTDVNMR